MKERLAKMKIECLGCGWRGSLGRLHSLLSHSVEIPDPAQPMKAESRASVVGFQCPRCPKILLEVCDYGLLSAPSLIPSGGKPCGKPADEC
jgi:hypothetical protein